MRGWLIGHLTYKMISRRRRTGSVTPLLRVVLQRRAIYIRRILDVRIFPIRIYLTATCCILPVKVRHFCRKTCCPVPLARSLQIVQTDPFICSAQRSNEFIFFWSCNCHEPRTIFRAILVGIEPVGNLVDVFVAYNCTEPFLVTLRTNGFAICTQQN